MNGIIVKKKCSLNFKSISIKKSIAVLLAFAMITSNFSTLTTADACEQSEIAIIDTNVSDAQVLIEGIRPGVEVISINSEEDGINQIAKALDGRHNIDAIHIVSHGEAGKVSLGGSVLTGQNLEKYEQQLASIGKALKENGNILLYGCNIASGEKGAAFINKLADYTHAELSASANSTGSTSRGGDWILEYNTGKEQVPDLFDKELQNTYNGLLGDIILSVEGADVNGGGVGPGVGPELISGEAGSLSYEPGAGARIYYTDKNTGAKAGQVSLFNWADPSIGGYAGISKGIFHARVDNDGYNYSDYSNIYTQYMVIEKTDYSSFNFKQAKFAFGGKMTLVVEGFRGETSTGRIEYIYSEDGVKNVSLNGTILTPEKFQNVDKVKITGKGYADAPSLQDVLDTGIVNLCSVTVGDPVVPQMTYEAGAFTESTLNDGTITTTKTVTLSGDTFAAGPFTEGNHYTTANVPSGMTLTVAKNSDAQLTLSLTGTATAHENLNDISNLTISFKNAAFAGNNVSAILNSTKNDMVIDFTDATDLTAYNAALAAVKELDYTTDSWAAYQSVVTANVMTASNTQSQVDVATNAIKAAQAKLVKVVDANLAAAKAAEKKLISTDYVDYSAVTAALKMAEGTDEEKIAKTTAINDAIKVLVKKSDLTAYNAALSAVKESDYTTGSWAAYKLVVTANVMTVSNTQSQVDAATNAIKAAQAKLIKVVDANLSAAKEAEKLLESTDYVDYGAVTAALAMAEGTDEEKVLKTTAINNAIKALVKKSDLTAYNAALAAVKESDYTTDSWTAYQSVVTANVMTVSNTQSQVDAATNAIKEAQAKLIKVVDANLAAAKAAAVAELNKYKTSTDYSAENWALISQRKVIGAAEINNAATIESVAAALAAAKADIDKISTIVITYSVKYHGNGNDSGSVPTDSASYTKGSYAKVMSSGNLTKSGYTFSSWNTASDGSGTCYKLNDTFAVTADVTLYAQWSKIIEAEIPVFTSSNVRGTEVVNQKEKATELSVTAVVKDGGTLSYQWYLITNKADIIGDKIDEATSSKYLPSTTSSGIFGYYVVVKNTVTVNGETKTATNKSSVKEVVVIDLPPSVYSVSLNGGNLSGNVKFSVNTTQTAIQYQNYIAKLAANSGYTLPNSIKVVMNKETLVSGIDYIYSKTTGALTVYNVTGDLSISAEGVLIPIKIYTIAFNSNGGSDVPSLTGAYGKAITLQTPTKPGYKFGGWYRDSNFATSYVSDKIGAENLVLYAKWEQMNYSINGNVKDEDNKNVSGAIVMIMAGSREVAKTTTDSFGNFSITGVLKGTYNLVVSNGTEQTITLTITISDSNIGIGTVILPSGNKNSVVEVKPDTPDIVVDKLNDFFESTQFTQDDKNIVDSGGTVEIKLTVEKKDESGDNAAANANFIINAAGSANNVGMLFEINLSKIVTSKIDNVDIIEKPVAINELDDLLTINIPLSDDLIGKDEYVIYRYHINEINKITQTKNSDGEYIELSSDGKYIKLHAKKFSTYAIAYSMNSSHGGSSSTVDEIKITAETSTGGKIAVSSDKKTVQIIPDEGYVIVDVLVDSKRVGATEAYSFSDNKSHRIGATFVKESALPYYMKNNQKVFVGLSAISNKILKYTAPQGVTVEFKENPKGFEDIKNHWGKTNIDFVTERELFLGTTDKNFSPDKGMTRAMLVTVIGRLYERSYGNISGSTSFADADNNAYYADYLAWADENGIIKGMNGKFMPDSEVTREQMAEIMFRFAKYLDKAPKGSWMINVTYKDKAEISNWAMESAAYCQLTGLISGRDGGKFAPKANVTRAEVSTIIERFINNFYK